MVTKPEVVIYPLRANIFSVSLSIYSIFLYITYIFSKYYIYFSNNDNLIMNSSYSECDAFILKHGHVLTYAVSLIPMAGCLFFRMTGNDAGQAVLTGT